MNSSANFAHTNMEPATTIESIGSSGSSEGCMIQTIGSVDRLVVRDAPSFESIGGKGTMMKEPPKGHNGEKIHPADPRKPGTNSTQDLAPKILPQQQQQDEDNSNTQTLLLQVDGDKQNEVMTVMTSTNNTDNHNTNSSNSSPHPPQEETTIVSLEPSEEQHDATSTVNSAAIAASAPPAVAENIATTEEEDANHSGAESAAAALKMVWDSNNNQEKVSPKEPPAPAASIAATWATGSPTAAAAAKPSMTAAQVYEEEEVDDGDKKPAALPGNNQSDHGSAAAGAAIPRPKAISRGLRGRSAPAADIGTPEIGTPRCAGARGLGQRARRSQEGGESRRQQIRERAAGVGAAAATTTAAALRHGHSPEPTPFSAAAATATTASLRHSYSPEPAPFSAAANTAMNVTSTPVAAASAPGDSLAAAISPAATATSCAAPGDNLASLPSVQRSVTPRSRPITPQHGKVQNPGPNAYEGIPVTTSAAASATAAGTTAADSTTTTSDVDSSLKQRLRRQQNNTDDNTPSSIRPGAYKEIPGRGLVRNETLRFNVMNTIQRQRESLRSMFSSRRNATGSASNHSHDLSTTNENQADRGENNTQHVSFATIPRRGLLSRARSRLRGGGGVTGLATNAASASSFRNRRAYSSHNMRASAMTENGDCIAGILVEEGGNDTRSYVGNVSLRSITNAEQQGGLCVARPNLLE